MLNATKIYLEESFLLNINKRILNNVLFKIVDKFPVDFNGLMSLEVQIVKDKLEVLDKRNERGCFFFLVHRFKRTGDKPFLNLVV